MSREQIDAVICKLAGSQGFYGRLRAGHYGDYESILDYLESVHPKSDVDIVLALES